MQDKNINKQAEAKYCNQVCGKEIIEHGENTHGKTGLPPHIL